MTGVSYSRCSRRAHCRTRCATTRTCSLALPPHTSRSTLQLGKLGLRTLTGISTAALKSDDATYAALENKIMDLTKRRNEIALKMITILENASFHGHEINEEEAEHLIEQAEDLLGSIE